MDVGTGIQAHQRDLPRDEAGSPSSDNPFEAEVSPSENCQVSVHSSLQKGMKRR